MKLEIDFQFWYNFSLFLQLYTCVSSYRDSSVQSEASKKNSSFLMDEQMILSLVSIVRRLNDTFFNDFSVYFIFLFFFLTFFKLNKTESYVYSDRFWTKWNYIWLQINNSSHPCAIVTFLAKYSSKHFVLTLLMFSIVFLFVSKERR